MRDADLIDRFLAGDDEAVELVETWIVQPATPFRRRLAVAWDDVLQDLRLEVTRLLREGKFHGRSSLRTYLSRVVCHTCLDRLRAMKKRHWVDLEALDEEADADLVNLGIERRDPISRDLLRRVMPEMSAECRTLWSMLFEGFSYREMSEQSRVSEGALRVRVLRCRQKALRIRDRILGVRPEKERNVRDVSTPVENVRNG